MDGNIIGNVLPVPNADFHIRVQDLGLLAFLCRHPPIISREISHMALATQVIGPKNQVAEMSVHEQRWPISNRILLVNTNG